MSPKIILVLSFIAFLSAAKAQPGHIDTTYNTFDNGSLFPTSVDDYIRESHIYPDGKYLLGGEFTTFNGQPVNKLIRVDNNGQIDPNFNSGGTGPNGDVRGFKVLNNNKILIFGDFSSYNGVPVDSIALLLADGTPDPSFSLPVSPIFYIYSVAEQSNGYILLTGQTSNSSAPDLVRISQEGVIDNTLNALSVNPNGLFFKVYTDTHDNIYAVGSFSQLSGHATERIARLNPNGAVDISFAIPSGYGNSTNDILVNADSTIVACGSYSDVLGNNVPGLHGYFKTFPNGQIDSTFQHAASWSHYNAITKDSADRYYIFSSNNQYKSIRRILSNGAPDPNFNEFTHAAGGAQGHVYSIKVEPTGKILLAGRELTRRNSDGTKDETFLSPRGVNGTVHAVKTLPDGKAYIGGSFSGYNHVSRNGIVRLLADGQIDLSFDPGSGAVIGVSEYQANQTIRTIEVQNDGKVLVGGGFIKFNNTSIGRLVRLNPDGSIDSSFAVNAGFNNTVLDIAIQPDGKILVCGEFTGYNQTGTNMYCGGIIRLNSDGTYDTSFQPAYGANDVIRTIKILSNGKIMVGGDFTYFGNQWITRLCRINPDGSIDNTFNPGTGPNWDVYEIEEDTAGRPIILSGAGSYNGTPVNCLFRTTVSGALDTLFLSDTILDFMPRDIHLQPDGKLLIAGQFFNVLSGTHIGRLFPNGTLDTSFHYPTQFGSNDIRSIDLFADGSILAGGGSVYYFGVPKRGVFKFINDIPNSGCEFFNAGISSVADIACGDSASTIAYCYEGLPPYAYSWDNSGFSEDDTTFTTNAGGIHYLSVIDSAGCHFSTGFLVNGPSSAAGFDHSVNLVPSTFRPGFASYATITGTNLGCVPSSGSMVLIIDTLLTFVTSSPLPDQIVGDSLIWNFSNQVYDQSDIVSTVHFITDPAAQIGENVDFRTIVTPVAGDADTTNNSYEYSFPIINGYDPNDKQVYPEGECLPHYIGQGEKLTYTVRFQNTGNAEAINISVLDSLSEHLQLHTLRVIASSHTMFTEVRPGHTVAFRFNGINLPDSASNEPASHGYVVYEILPEEFIYPGSVIRNKAHIYFDFNPAIITNEVFNTISADGLYYHEDTISVTAIASYEWNGTTYNQSGVYAHNYFTTDGCDSLIFLDLTIEPDVTGISETVAESSWEIVPNPTTGVCAITPIASEGELLIVNSLGQVLQRLTISPENNMVDLSHLENGVYQFEFSSGVAVTRKSVLLHR